ncbi:acyl-CoA dehydrogenase family protein [Lentibacter sp.]|uniref:acyl-CoA dehydrogenase family protein n=1 Tax=Lentibacter sp. TaxID=2024994 RepID=UPI003F6D148E
MDMTFSPQEEEFRSEVRRFFQDNLPQAYSEKIANGVDLEKAELEDWHAILNTRGWLAYDWPKEFGGPGWGPMQIHIFNEELALAEAPRVLAFNFKMLAPVLMKFGTREQCSHWLPRMLDGTDWWCQGYSEPGSGSDLASLRTTAVRDGDHYVVNGQKTWTTLGQHANMIFCLVRTSKEGKPQSGISFLLIDMASPGVELRPIRTIDGGYEINEIFLTNVRVPVGNLVGEENKGWTYAKYLLTHERTGIALVGDSKRKLDRLKALFAQEKASMDTQERVLLSARIARVEIDLTNMNTTNLRVLASVADGGAPDAESSMLKILGSEIHQELDSLIRRTMGRRAHAYLREDFSSMGASQSAGVYFNNRKLSIFGGSNEIQKNIISKMILGL